MQWLLATRHEDGRLAIPSKWLLPHYYDAITVLFRVENALRLFVYLVLKENFGAKWKDLTIASDEGDTSVNAVAKRRIEQTKTFGYLGYPIQSALMHLTSGELVGIITHDKYWPIFKNYFLAARNVVTLKLQEIGTVINALAHFRPVSAEDVDVVKLNAGQILSEVERTLINVMQCPDVVPSNTTDDWFTQLRTIGTDHISVSFRRTKDNRWIE